MKSFFLLLSTAALLTATSCSKDDDNTPAAISTKERVSDKPVQTSEYALSNYSLYAPNSLEPNGRVLFLFEYSGATAHVRGAYRRYLTPTTYDALGGFDLAAMQPGHKEVIGVDNQPQNMITTTSDLRIRLHRNNVFLGEWNLQTGEKIQRPLQD
jgi:hypothetical protein